MRGEMKAVARLLLQRSRGTLERPFLGNRRIVQMRQLTGIALRFMPIPQSAYRVAYAASMAELI